jgi:hypothetical protein
MSTSARPVVPRVPILLYDALDFSTDRDDGGGQTRESLSRVASPSAAVAGLDAAPTETHVALCDYRLAGCVRPRQSQGHARRSEARKRQELPWEREEPSDHMATCPSVDVSRPTCLQNSRALDQFDQGSTTAICCWSARPG